MPGFQFMHIESYGRVAGKSKSGGHSVSSIIGEARRDPVHSSHVDSPIPPCYLQGVSLDSLEAICEAYAATITDAKGRRMRKDGLCLLAGVVSAPDGFTEHQWSRLATDTLHWLEKRFGERLRTTVSHLDESHDHLHFYVIPLDGERFDDIHPGKAAARVAREKGFAKGDQNKAYIAAMREFQNDFFEHVSAKNGLTRLGPGRRRLARKEWKQEQAAAVLLAQQFDRATKMGVEAETIRADAQAAAKELAIVSMARADADAAALLVEAEKKVQRVVKRQKIRARNAGFQYGMESFQKRTLWGRLAALMSSAVRERDLLLEQIKTLTRQRDQARAESAQYMNMKAMVRTLKRVGRSLLGERDEAMLRTEKALRQRDQQAEVVRILRERDESYAALEAERDLQRARAELAERKLGQFDEDAKYKVKAPISPPIGAPLNELSK